MRTAAGLTRRHRLPLDGWRLSPPAAVHTLFSALLWIACSAAALGAYAYLAERSDVVHRGGFEP